MAKFDSLLGNENANGRVASRLNQRNQAASGSQGTTTGDSSGTGVNAKKKRKKVKAVGTPGGVRLGAAHRNDPGNIARGQLENLDRAVRRNDISHRAAAGIAQDISSSLIDSETKRLRIASTADIAQEKRDTEIANADATRGVQVSEGALDRGVQLSRANLASRDSELDRVQREGSDLRRDAQLGRQFDISEARQATADTNTAFQQNLATEQLGLSRDQFQQRVKTDSESQNLATQIAEVNAKDKQAKNVLSATTLQLGQGKALVAAGDPTKDFTGAESIAAAGEEGRQLLRTLGISQETAATFAQIAELPRDQQQKALRGRSSSELSAFYKYAQSLNN